MNFLQEFLGKGEHCNNIQISFSELFLNRCLVMISFFLYWITSWQIKSYPFKTYIFQLSVVLRYIGNKRQTIGKCMPWISNLTNSGNHSNQKLDFIELFLLCYIFTNFERVSFLLHVKTHASMKNNPYELEEKPKSTKIGHHKFVWFHSVQ